MQPSSPASGTGYRPVATFAPSRLQAAFQTCPSVPAGLGQEARKWLPREFCLLLQAAGGEEQPASFLPSPHRPTRESACEVEVL